MRYRLAAIAALATAALAAAGCNDDKFLTEVPFDFVGPANFYRNAGDAIAAVNGVYAGLVNNSGTQYYGGEYVMLVEYPTEMMTPYLSASNERSQVDNYTFGPAHNYIYHTWTSAYATINRANSVIDHVPSIAMDTTLRNRIVGEAKFLRALNYFNLVRLFGGVPLYTSETAGLDSLERPRASAADVYAVIVQDLTDAAKVLPKTYAGTDVGRATSGAAQSLLAKVYVQRAGTGVGTAADYQAAVDLLRAVEGTNTYALQANFSDMFDMKHENNPEIIFDIQATRAPGLGERLSSQCAPRKSNYGASQNGSFTAEQPFFDEYVAADKRKPITWQLTFVDKSNVVQTWDNTKSTASTGYGADAPYMRKCLDSLSTGYDEQNYIIQRYADNLLLKAEALNEVAGGPNAEAYAAINAVRTRAGIGTLVAGLSQSAFRDSVFHERRLELTFEGPNGYFDSQRNWAWASARIRASMNKGLANKFKNSKFPKADPFCPATATTCSDTSPIPDQFKLMPIPQKAMDLNPALRDQQNPGW